jgi:hypothetical protein
MIEPPYQRRHRQWYSVQGKLKPDVSSGFFFP